MLPLFSLITSCELLYLPSIKLKYDASASAEPRPQSLPRAFQHGKAGNGPGDEATTLSYHRSLKFKIINCYLYRLHITAVQSYPVRLTGGSSVYEGQVEVLYCVSSSSCAWRTVCASGWDTREASVTCSQLGLYNSTSAINGT